MVDKENVKEEEEKRRKEGRHFKERIHSEGNQRKCVTWERERKKKER